MGKWQQSTRLLSWWKYSPVCFKSKGSRESSHEDNWEQQINQTPPPDRRSRKKKGECETYLWIRMLWSENPCVSIITSASSRTNTRILVKSINFRLKHQSRTVPGVPIIICLVMSVPLGTGEKRVERLLKMQRTLTVHNSGPHNRTVKWKYISWRFSKCKPWGSLRICICRALG